MNELAHTVLYPLHREMGAKLQPFAGYLMPMQYGKGIIHEHHHTRSHAGFFDISHMGQLVVAGANAAQQLENLTPSDITGLSPGRQQYTVFTNESGGIIDDAVITRLDTKFLIIINAACKQKDLLHLQQHLSSGTAIEAWERRALFALQGPEAVTVISKFCNTAVELTFMSATETEISGIPCLISRSGYTGEDGFEISVAERHALQLAELLLAQDNVEPVGLGARNTLRLEAGLCLYGHELSETITPVEAGLQWLIKKGHDRFPGAVKILGQLQHPPDRLRVGIRSEQKIPIRDGAELYNDENQLIGEVTSGSFGPSTGYPIALARIKSVYRTPGTMLYARVRSRNLPVTTTPLPFIAHRYYRGSNRK